MDRNSQSSPLLASGGSQNVDQGIDRRGQFFPIEQSKEMNGVKFKYPTDSKQKYVSTGYPMYTNMNGGPRDSHIKQEFQAPDFHIPSTSAQINFAGSGMMGPMSSIPNCRASSNMPPQVGQNVTGVPFSASMPVGVQSSFVGAPVPSQLPVSGGNYWNGGNPMLQVPMSVGTNGFPLGNQFVPGGQYMNYGLNTFPPIVPPPNLMTQVPPGFPGNANAWNFPGNGFLNQMQPAVQLPYVYPGQGFSAGNQNNQPNFGYNVQQGYPVLAGNQNNPTNYQNGIHENQNGYQGNQNGNQGNQNGNQGNQNGNQGNQNGNQGNQNGNQGNQNGNQGNQNGNQGNQNGYEVPNRVANNNGNRNRRLDRVDVLPKTLRYNGNENWNAFKQKFMRYAQVKNWTADESKDYLCWILEGKASEFFSSILQRNHEIQFDDLLQKMEKRFGVKEIPETAQVKLATMKQQLDESIEDWADRVLQLATHAFQNLPDDFMYSQAIQRICVGCIDREAGQFAANQHLTTIEDVIDKIKGFQHNYKAIYDKTRREVREVCCETNEPRSDSGQSARICRTHSKSPKSDEDAKLDQRLSNLEKQMESLMIEIKSVNKRFENRGRQLSPNRRMRSRSPSPAQGGACYYCGGQGHFRIDCPKLQKANKASEKSVSFADSLNNQGSGQKA